MTDMTHIRQNPQVEISGWTADNDFFVEQAEVVEADNGEQRLFLRRDLPNGSLIFVRRSMLADGSAPTPRAYQVENVSHGAAGSEVRLMAVTRRSSGARTHGALASFRPVSSAIESEDNLRASNLSEEIFP